MNNPSVNSGSGLSHTHSDQGPHVHGSLDGMLQQRAFDTARVDDRRLNTKEIEEIMRNRPWLSGTTGKEVYNFLPAYERYKERLAVRHRFVRLDDCVKPVPLDWLLSRYNLRINEIDELEKRLIKKAKGYERILRRKVKDELLAYRMQIKETFSASMYKLVEDIETTMSQVKFDEDEEREICRLFVYKLPYWLMETSPSFTFQSKKLHTFSKIVQYLKELWNILSMFLRC